MKNDDIRNEIILLTNSLKELFDLIHCTQAKLKLTEARFWAEEALASEEISISEDVYAIKL